MNFLSPWFLAGFALIAGPIIAHLIRRVTRDRFSFSAMRFLKESPPRLSKRSRIQHPLLLLLRCLIVAVLAAGFARPFLRYDLPLTPATGVPQSVVALVNVSASMQRAGLWAAARQKIADLAATLKDGDQFALFAASAGVTELIGRERWAQTPPDARAGLVKSVLAGVTPGWGPMHLDAAIDTAIAQWEQMAEATDSTAHKKLVVVSDFTAGTHIAGLAGLAWPKNCEVVLTQLDPDHAGDTGLHWLGWAADTSAATTAGAPPPAAVARVSVSQSITDPARSLHLQLYDAHTGNALGSGQDLTVPAGDSQVALVPVPADAPDGPLRAELTGDAEPYDNTLWLVRPTPRRVELVYHGTHSPDDLKHARFYLERAVAGWKDPVVTVHAPTDQPTISPGPAPAPAPANRFDVVAEPLTPADAQTLRDRLIAGGFALVLLNDPAMVDTAAALAAETGWAPAATARPDALFGNIDFQHPLFSLFADPHYSNFASIHFWKPQAVTLPAATKAVVVARFDDNSPAVLEVPVGKGRLVVWGGDWSNAAGQWVISTKFVPWLESLVERSLGGGVRAAVAEVGDTGRLVSGPAQWRSALDINATFVNTPPMQPGVYELLEGGTTRLVAVEVPASESRIEPIPLDDFEKLGVPLHASLTDINPALALAPPKPAPGTQTAIVLEGRQKLWRWLLAAAAMLLAAESLCSYALARRDAAPAAAK
jgi:hypothetical protein